MPLEVEKLIDISDPVYTFCEVMEHGISSLREIEKLCRTDIRYMYPLDDMKAPSFVTFGNLIRNELTDSIEQIFVDINTYIFQKDHVNPEHTYIDGTKTEANANRYTWVWKKHVSETVAKFLRRYPSS